MGYSKDEWVLLSPEQQMEARQKQAAVDAENRRVQAEQDAARRQADADAAARHESDIDHRYYHARYGDVVSVNIEGGTMRFDGKDRKYDPVAFDLVRGEAKEIHIEREDKHNVYVRVVCRLSEDGRTLYYDDASDRKLKLVEKTWDKGQVYPIAVHNNDNSDPRNVTFTIRYKPLRRR